MEHHNIKESEQLALLSLSDVAMTEGESKTQDITPIITGKAARTTKVFIYNSDKESARTITVMVEKKEEPQQPTTATDGTGKKATITIKIK